MVPCFHRVVNFSGRGTRSERSRRVVGRRRLGTVGVTGKPDQWLETDRRIDNVGRLTPGAGIESSTRMGSDLTAAEALQEAETEVGVAVKVGQGGRVAGRPSIDRHGG